MGIDGTYTFTVKCDGEVGSFTLAELFAWFRFKKKQSGEPAYFLSGSHYTYIDILEKFPRTAWKTYQAIVAWRARTPLPRNRSLVVMEKHLPKRRR